MVGLKLGSPDGCALEGHTLGVPVGCAVTGISGTGRRKYDGRIEGFSEIDG